MSIDPAHRDSGWKPECSEARRDGDGSHRFTDWSLYVLTKTIADKLRIDRLIAARCCKACGLIEQKER